MIAISQIANDEPSAAEQHLHEETRMAMVGVHKNFQPQIKFAMCSVMIPNPNLLKDVRLCEVCLPVRKSTNVGVTFLHNAGVGL